MRARRGARVATFDLPELRVSLTYAPGLKVESRHLARSHRDMAPLLARFVGDAMDRERMVAALLDTRNRVLGLTVIAVGNGTEVYVRISDVFRPLILGGAVRFYLGHTHPSGDETPSDLDLGLTRLLHEVGLSLGIELCDHLVIGANGAYWSMRQHGEAVPAWAQEARGDRGAVQRYVQEHPATDKRPSRGARRGAAPRRGLALAWSACGRRQPRGERRSPDSGVPRFEVVVPRGRAGKGRPVPVALDDNQAEWLCAHGGNPGAALLGVLNAEIRRETLKKAVTEEDHLRALICKHAHKLERRLRSQHPPPSEEELGVLELEARAERELLPAFDQSEDLRTRHAAMRLRFRYGIRPDGTHSGQWAHCAELQRLREQRPGGWR